MNVYLRGVCTAVMRLGISSGIRERTKRKQTSQMIEQLLPSSFHINVPLSLRLSGAEYLRHCRELLQAEGLRRATRIYRVDGRQWPS